MQIQQQIMTGDSAENIKMGRPEPTLEKGGKNKEILQDSQIVIGLFNPTRINPPLANYGGYQMKDFDNKFRSIHILKHREGDDGLIKCMYFHGVSSKYEELPKPNTPELTQFINKLKVTH